MTKDEELKTLCPAPKKTVGQREEEYEITAKAGKAEGRYVKGKVLTVALWGKRKEPMAVWYFCGEDWTGILPGKKDAGRRELHPDCIYQYHRMVQYRKTKLSAANEKEFGKYFGIKKIWNIFDEIEKAMGAKAKKKTEQTWKKLADRAAEVEDDCPEYPSDLEMRIKKTCRDALLLWYSDKKIKTVDFGGVPVTQTVQEVTCGLCGETYIYQGEEGLRHKEERYCEKCKALLTAHNTRYGSRSKYNKRTFLLGQKTEKGLWLTKLLVNFTYLSEERRINIHVMEEEKFFLGQTGEKIHWKYDRYSEKWYLTKSANIKSMLYWHDIWGYTDGVWCEPELEGMMTETMHTAWVKQYMPKINIEDMVLLFDNMKKVPMAESLIKTGWGWELIKLLTYGRERMNIRSKSYYGFFGLNRQEMKVAGDTKKFEKVEMCRRWKEAGLPVTEENYNLIKKIGIERELSGICETYGAKRVLKYLRQETRRKGKGKAVIDNQIASDWIDYVDMAKHLGMDMTRDIILFPLDLKRRHDDLVESIREKEATERRGKARKENSERAKYLEKKFEIEKQMKRIRKTYEWDEDGYSIVVPAGAADIIDDGQFLGHCVASGERYFERISQKESYILFLRHTEKKDVPWYTLEVEPGGTIRQKRSYGNEQYKDLEDAKIFLGNWQNHLQEVIDQEEKELAERSRKLRAEEFDKLKEQRAKIRTGRLRGKLLVEELMADLMESKCGA